MLSVVAVALLAGSAAAYPRTPLLFTRQAYGAPGVATFNDYASQSSTVCNHKTGSGGTYGAAASDVSPDISGGACSATIDTSKCSGTQAVSGYAGPSCPTSNCGTCYKVTNKGAIGGGSIGGIGNSITVQIIDSCPSESADNYCKTDVPANERCGDRGTNQLDIDQSAYQALTGTPFGSGPNLQIEIAPSDCSGGSSDNPSASVEGAASTSTPVGEAAASSVPGGNPGGSPASPTAPAGGAATTPASGGNQGGSQGGGPGGAATTPGSPGGAVHTTRPKPPAQSPVNPATPSSPAGGGKPVGGGGGAPLYAQCGGIDNSNNGAWSGPTTCAAPATCQMQNHYYSQCLPAKRKMGKRDAIAIEDSKPFFESEHLLQKREAVLIKEGKPFFLSGSS